MKSGRTMVFAIWRACERFGILPPGTTRQFDECNTWAQSMIVSYDQIRQIEEDKRDVMLAKAGRF